MTKQTFKEYVGTRLASSSNGASSRVESIFSKLSIELWFLPITFLRYLHFRKYYRIERRAIRQAFLQDVSFQDYMIEYGFYAEVPSMVLKSMQIVAPSETDMTNEQIVANYRSRIANTVIQKLIEKQLIDVVTIEIDRINKQLILITMYPCNLQPFKTFRNAVLWHILIYACLITFYYLAFNN